MSKNGSMWRNRSKKKDQKRIEWRMERKHILAVILISGIVNPINSQRTEQTKLTKLTEGPEKYYICHRCRKTKTLTRKTLFSQMEEVSKVSGLRFKV